MLKEKIEADFKKAFKEGDKARLSVLRMLKSELTNEQKEKRYQISQKEPDLSSQELEEKSSLNDEEVREVVFSLIKKSKQAVEEFQKGDREDLVKKEEKEIETLKHYLPKQLSDAKIKEMAQEVIEEVGAEGMKDMGKVMNKLMTRAKGRAEGSRVAEVVKKLLS